MSETSFKNAVMARLNGMPNTWAVKFHGSPMVRGGVPDILISHCGKFVGAELKVGNNEASKLQKYEMAKIVKAGGVAGVARTWADVETLLAISRNPTGWEYDPDTCAWR